MNSFSCFFSMREASSRCSEALRLETMSVSRDGDNAVRNRKQKIETKTQGSVESVTRTRPL